jgi:hypothetical protein
MARSFRTLFMLTVLASIFLATAASAADKPFDPCSLLTPAEIQAVLGVPVKAAPAKAQPNPAAAAGCTYVVNDFGSLNVLVQPLYASYTPAMYRDKFAEMKMKPVDLPGVGDSSFFTSPGFEMVQLHTFKASKYILFTLMDPGRKEAAARPLAAKLMRIVVTRIK